MHTARARFSLAAAIVSLFSPLLSASPIDRLENDRAFESGYELFFLGPAWFRNALSLSPATRTARATAFVYDRSGDGGILEAAYVGTLRDSFNVALFDAGPFFAAPARQISVSPTALTVTNTINWDGGPGGTGDEWLSSGNWDPDNVPDPDDIAVFGAAGSASSIRVSFFGNPTNNGTNNQAVGAIQLLGTINRTIGAGPVTSGTLTLNGATVNGVANTILANDGTATLTLQPNVGGSAVMTVALGNATDNIVQVNSSGLIVINASITGAGRNLTKTGPGLLLLNGANTYTGNTSILGGELFLGSPGSISSSSTIRLGDTAGSNPATFTFGASGGGVTVASPLVVQSGSTGTKTILALGTNGNTNTYSGSITMNDDLVVQSAASGTTAATGQGILNLTGTIDVLNNTFEMNSNLRSNNADTYSIQGIVQVSGQLTSSLAAGGSLIKDGSGTLILENINNTYTGTDANALNPGGTRIRGGVLGIYGDGSLGLAPGNIFGTNNVFFESSAYATNTDSIAPTLRAYADGIVINGTRFLNIATNVTAQLDSNGYTFTIDGSIGGAGNLRKVGAGSVVLTSANFFSGTTTVAEGTLNAAFTLSLAGTSSITVNRGGTLMVSGDGDLNRIDDSTPIILGSATGTGTATFRKGDASTPGGFVSEGSASSAGMGALTLLSNSTFDFGTIGVGTFTFAGFNPGTFTLNVLNWSSNADFQSLTPGVSGTDDRLIFAGALPPDTLSITFDGAAAGFIPLGPGFYEVVPLAPVPEPSTWVGAALALGAVGWVARGKLRTALAALL